MNQKTNKEKADEFLKIVSEDKRIIHNMKYKVLFKHKSYLTEDFEDFYQDTLLKCYSAILKNGGDFPSESRYKGYMYRALKNNYQGHQKDYIENQKMIKSLDYYSDDVEIRNLSDEIFDEELNMKKIEDDKEFDFNIKLMKERIKVLPDYLKEPIYLHYWDKKSYKEIAKILNITFNMVRNRMYNARQELKK